MERRELDKALEETIEFNDRIENPEEWRKKIKKRQQNEAEELKDMRDSVKVTMVLENNNSKHFPASFRSRSQLVNQSVGNPLFQ